MTNRPLASWMTAPVIAGALASLAAPVPATGALAAQEPSADTVVEVGAEGTTLAFLPDRLTLRAGTRVTLRFVNGGTLPHNLVLLRSDERLDEMAMAAYDAADTDYVPEGYDDDILARTPLLSPDQTAEVSFVVPPPGEYVYICLFPGHANMMLGTLRSRE